MITGEEIKDIRLWKAIWYVQGPDTTRVSADVSALRGTITKISENFHALLLMIIDPNDDGGCHLSVSLHHCVSGHNGHAKVVPAINTASRRRLQATMLTAFKQSHTMSTLVCPDL